MLRVLNRASDTQLSNEEKASAPLAGGILQNGYQCGMVWGAALAAGAEAYKRLGSGPQAETMAMVASQRVVESFRTNYKHINCLEITEIDKSSTTMQLIVFFLIKGGTFKCFKMSAKYAKIAFSEINTAFSEISEEVPDPPVSCTAMLAQKMGASDMHMVMAAGLAGGIGLCGGACGALGTAIWIDIMKRSKDEDFKIDFKDAKSQAIIDKFVKCTDYKFECSEIVGRKFESIDDHAEYVRNGGCSKLIEVLSGD